ncbi:hypothetical protein RFI_31605 [Reticulomyxa filosa]|uniref:Uncharacterized protein n=1 Tax=Reticulomyxa filosa TaxID=46433 RepID=X6LXC2_RETFI|nr:hypothetical protein RFI_31605 [Reticulomyxa filosa]|eukprot:ETO05787.1 hypothetical protein RFI_31605 [Reticulomyxa filosa]
MIPFMSGILYNNIISNKDLSGSGLLYFWKLLHSPPPQIVPIHQVVLFMHCLDACKADTTLYASSIAKIALKLNEKQLNKVFECLMPLRVEKLQFVMDVHMHLQRFHHNCEENSWIMHKWSDKKLDITVQCLIDGFQNINEYDHDIFRYLPKGIAMKLNETQIDSVSHV